MGLVSEQLTKFARIITTPVTQSLILDSGILKSIVFNYVSKSVADAGQFYVYDGYVNTEVTSGLFTITGSLIAQPVIGAAAFALPYVIEYNIPFNTGLVVAFDSTGSIDINVVWKS